MMAVVLLVLAASGLPAFLDGLACSAAAVAFVFALLCLRLAHGLAALTTTPEPSAWLVVYQRWCARAVVVGLYVGGISALVLAVALIQGFRFAAGLASLPVVLGPALAVRVRRAPITSLHAAS